MYMYTFLLLYDVYLAIYDVYFPHYGVSGDEATSFAYLQHLTKVPRFQMVNMFMSSEEKQGDGKGLKQRRDDVVGSARGGVG